MFVGVDGYEIESLRRSLAMLPPNAAGLSREEAMRFLTDLQTAEGRLRQLREGLVALLELTSSEAD